MIKKSSKLSATICGTNPEGVEFVEALAFGLIPPSDDNYYGTGYYMSVERISLKDNISSQSENVDVRYEKMTDVQTLAERWIESHYGDNAKSVSMVVTYE